MQGRGNENENNAAPIPGSPGSEKAAVFVTGNTDTLLPYE